METTKSKGATIIRNLYLYVVSAISLFMIVFALVSLVNLGLRTWIFPKADDNYYSAPMGQPACVPSKDGTVVCPTAADQAKIDAQNKQAQADNAQAQRQRDLVQNISFLIVSLPLFTYHWMVIRRDRAESHE
ncbi:MAG: hypothetical protein NT003_03555 [Candidatus Magasanikbacteria bacterium]|nr:hypothetical protein [Candidatus Magasanikbacteria bacterium]